MGETLMSTKHVLTCKHGYEDKVKKGELNPWRLDLVKLCELTMKQTGKLSV